MIGNLKKKFEETRIKTNFNDKSNISVDLGGMNILKATKTAILVSTYHFLEYNEGKVCFEVDDENVKKYISPMKLKNTVLKLK